MATRAVAKQTTKAKATASKSTARGPAKLAKAPAKKATTKATKKTARAKPAAKTPAKKAPPAAKAPAKKAAAKTGSGTALKTRPETTSVADFIKALDDPQQRADSQILVQMMRAATGCEPVMWGSSIIGFDRYHYRYDSGHEGDMALVGFSPRKGQLVLYVMPGFAGQEALLAKLGRHRTGKSCLYVRHLADVDAGILGRIVDNAVAEMRRRYPR
jgi:hypothetical protein